MSSAKLRRIDDPARRRRGTDRVGRRRLYRSRAGLSTRRGRFPLYREARKAYRSAEPMPAKPKTHRFDTLALHAGARPDPATGARATPIYQTSSFVFPDADHAAALFNMERAGHVYSRLSNPTCAVLEER